MERISMSRRERRRAEIRNRIEEGRISIAQAAETLRISGRQAKRIWARFRDEGDAGIGPRAHGRPSNRRADPAFRERVLSLCAEHYAGYGPTLAFRPYGLIFWAEDGTDGYELWLRGERVVW